MWEDAIPIERLVQLASAQEGPLTEMICARLRYCRGQSVSIPRAAVGSNSCDPHDAD
jgi:hypothetical protein